MLSVFFKSTFPLLKIVYIRREYFFVFNYKDDYSINASCFVRFSKGNDIILTSSDVYLDNNNKHLDYTIYDEKQGIAGTLMEINILKMQDALKETKVEKIEISDTADVSILFENGCRLDLFVDCLMENYEFYRFFKIVDDSIHNIIIYKQELGLIFVTRN